MPMKKPTSVSITSSVIVIDDSSTVIELLGNNDSNLDIIEEAFDDFGTSKNY